MEKPAIVGGEAARTEVAVEYRVGYRTTCRVTRTSVTAVIPAGFPPDPAGGSRTLRSTMWATGRLASIPRGVVMCLR